MDIKQQTDKLWNWCGFEYHWYPITCGGVSKQRGWYLNGKFRCANKPHKNLDNFYRFAIPKLQKEGYTINLMAYNEGKFLVVIRNMQTHRDIAVEDADSPTEALYNAIMKIIDNEEK